MPALAVQPLSGTYRADPVHSAFAFAVRHSDLYRYRGTLSDAEATLRITDADATLDGFARVDSISIGEPAAFRDHVLGEDFFDAERHPEVTFRSTAVRLGADGRAEVDGELTIRGVTRPVVGRGRFEGPQSGPFGGEVAGLHLQTSIDRRDFGFAWQMAMPGGGDVLGWEVELDIELRLERHDED